MLLLIAAAAASAAPVPNMPRAIAENSARCPRSSSYYAYRGDDPLKPRKLTELPPAVGYMAVYRTVNGCEVPLTMVEYRKAQRR